LSEDGENGKVQEEKTPEQIRKERFERYQLAPDTFIELSDVVFVAFRNTKSALGVSFIVGNCKRSEMDISEIEIVHRLSMLRSRMDIEAQMKKQAEQVLVPKHGMMDFMRRKK
jgi:hypothetical protein